MKKNFENSENFVKIVSLTTKETQLSKKKKKIDWNSKKNFDKKEIFCKSSKIL